MEDAIAAPQAATPEPVAQAQPTPEPQAQAPVFEKTPRGAVERAMAKLSGERERDAGGRFLGSEKPAAQPQPTGQPTAQKPADGFHEPPGRFSADAKAAWAALPDAVKAETHRALKELESGIGKYKTDAEAFAELKEFQELASQHGTTMKEAMGNYVAAERLLRQDVVAGLDAICGNLGVSLADVARHIVKHLDGAQPGSDQPAPQPGSNEALIAELRKEIASIKGQFGAVAEDVQRRQHGDTVSYVEAFATDPKNERWNELENDVLSILKGQTSYRVDHLPPDKRLPEAYRLAALLKPATAPAPVIAAPAAPNPDPATQTRRGSLSVTGAPGGSDPALRRPGSSIRESIERAKAQIG